MSANTPHTFDPFAEPTGVRLQKVMAGAGVASRRVSEDMIAAGRVTVNGETVTEPGRRVDPEVDEIAVDGIAVQLDDTKRYIMLNKPVGIVSSLLDDRGREDLRRYTDDFDERLFNVGRLDAETSGLLILTNDGDVAHILAHPSFGVSKTYVAHVEGRASAQVIAKLTAGFDLEDGFIKADKARLIDAGREESIVEITIHSGKNRIVRRMLDHVGFPVLDLVRRSFGPLNLGTLGSDMYRDLTRDELGAILTLARAAAEETKPARKDKPRHRDLEGDAEPTNEADSAE